MKIDKEELKRVMISNFELVIKELKDELASKATSADLDEDNTLDPEDYSTQTVSSEMVLLMKNQIVKAEEDLNKIKAMDFSSKEEASVGALVTTDMFNFFIGIASLPFLLGNLQIVGVSPDAPIYSSLKGRKAGESFVFAGNTYNIHTIQ
jgi:hypothetical protein